MRFSVFEDTLGTLAPIEEMPVEYPSEPPAPVPVQVPPVVTTPTTVNPSVNLPEPVEPIQPIEKVTPPYVPPETTAPIAPAAWAIGMFYGSAPGAPSIVLSILPSGAVSVNIGGSITNGQLQGTTLQVGSQTATVSQLANGIRTVSGSQTIDYSSTPPSVGIPIYTTPVIVPPVVTIPIGTSTPPVPTPPVVPPSTPPDGVPPVEKEGSVNLGGVEIDNTTLLIGGGLIAAIFLLK